MQQWYGLLRSAEVLVAEQRAAIADCREQIRQVRECCPMSAVSDQEDRLRQAASRLGTLEGAMQWSFNKGRQEIIPLSTITRLIEQYKAQQSAAQEAEHMLESIRAAQARRNNSANGSEVATNEHHDPEHQAGQATGSQQ